MWSLIMADKDKKLSVGEMVAILAIAAVLTAALYAIANGVWKWATANRKRAWVCVPILLWSLVFVPVQIIGIILMSMTGLANFSELNPATPDQEFVNGVVTWSDVVIAFVISLLISRRVVRKLFPAAPESPKAGWWTKERLQKYFAASGLRPSYTDVGKWMRDNFTGDIYTGPDLTEYGFRLTRHGGSTIQQIKPWERIEHHWIFQDNLENNMESWNRAMTKLREAVEREGQPKSGPRD
jgi:hypothetical protein